MANHPSAEKRNRQRLARTRRNRSVVTAVRSVVKKARVALGSGDAKSAGATVAEASRALARAASKGVVHPKAAARTTARIQSALNKLARG